MFSLILVVKVNMIDRNVEGLQSILHPFVKRGIKIRIQNVHNNTSDLLPEMIIWRLSKGHVRLIINKYSKFTQN